MKPNLRRMLWVVMMCIFLFGCSRSIDPAAGVVNDYLKAMVASDSTQTAGLACKTFEDQAVKDADSFAGVKASLDGASCMVSGGQGDTKQVICTGKISATYGNEQQNFDLAGPVYTVVQQGGNWLVCGRQ